MNTLSLRRRLLAVLCGGFCGTITRYLLSGLIQGYLGKGWPYDILLINLTGAFILSCVTTLAETTLLVGPTRRLFINVGFLGAYTTFSSLALGDVLLAANDNPLTALIYLVLSITGGVLAVLLGDAFAQWCVKRAARPVSSASSATGKLAETRTAFPFDGRKGDSHVDIPNELLLPNARDEHEPELPLGNGK
jgi:fluoride exporter